jgi:hypothetical protein
VEVVPAVDPDLPTKNGEGPYGARHHATDNDLEFGAQMQLVGHPTLTVLHMVNACAIKLEDIFPAGFDTSGVTVRGKDSAMDPYFTIGADKSGSQAILGTYIGTKADWDAAAPSSPTFTVELILEKAGYSPTPIKVTMSYELSYYTAI